MISGSRVTDDPYSVGEVDGLARARGVHLELDAVASGMALLAKFEPGSTSPFGARASHRRGRAAGGRGRREAPVNEFTRPFCPRASRPGLAEASS